MRNLNSQPILIKRTLILAIIGLVSSLSYGQDLTCEKLAKGMAADTTKSIWEYDDVLPGTYYCLGKYFAQRDINNEVLLIHTYGSPEWANPCVVCRYESHGYSFYYHFDIILENVTMFMNGYNEISKAYLKTTIGDSAFEHLDDLSEGYFNPMEAFIQKVDNRNYQGLFDLEIINDTTINVKVMVDSLFKDYPQIVTRVAYGITDFNLKNKIPGQIQVMSYQEIKETGFRLTEKSNDRYYFKISFDFEGVPSGEKFCWCATMNKKQYSYIIPLTIKR